MLNQELTTYCLDVSGLLGTVAPCVLYGSNVERLAAGQGTFANSCLPYTGLYLLGNSLFGWNCLAPWFSHPTRTAPQGSPPWIQQWALRLCHDAAHGADHGAWHVSYSTTFPTLVLSVLPVVYHLLLLALMCDVSPSVNTSL
uniref:Uncharacterized protein n=1 Tax=Zea mays TaxID=4577 RepID=B4FHF9_MAIZE|nr:unknown [Zea mays]